jgi:hypothetical protein
VQREAVRRWPSRRWGVIWQAAAARTPTKDSHLARDARFDGPTPQRVGASELDPWKKLRVDESRPIWRFSQSVSQCILGIRLSCIFTEQRRHYSTLLGPREVSKGTSQGLISHVTTDLLLLRNVPRGTPLYATPTLGLFISTSVGPARD